MKENIKFLKIVLIVSTFVVVGKILHALLRTEAARKKRLSRHLQKYSRKVLKALNVTYTFSGDFPENHSYMLVSNHLSYLDVLVLSSIRPTVFITSREVEKTFLLGDICKAGGSLFVERRNRNFLQDEISKLQSVTEAGVPLALFPEGTTSNGAQILPFKISLFEVAIRNQCPVLPVCINYERINNQKVDRTFRDSVFYYGDMEFLPHLKSLIRLDKIEVTVKATPILQVDAQTHRKEIASKAFNEIQKNYHPVL